MIKAYEGDRSPKPEVDMIVEDENGQKFILKPCTCFTNHNGSWNKYCGPHLYKFSPDGNHKPTSRICYNEREGWLKDYTILSEIQSVVSNISRISTCPLCAARGEILFTFHCTNPCCRNYR